MISMKWDLSGPQQQGQRTPVLLEWACTPQQEQLASAPDTQSRSFSASLFPACSSTPTPLLWARSFLAFQG